MSKESEEMAYVTRECKKVIDKLLEVITPVIEELPEFQSALLSMALVTMAKKAHEIMDAPLTWKKTLLAADFMSDFLDFMVKEKSKKGKNVVDGPWGKKGA